MTNKINRKKLFEKTTKILSNRQNFFLESYYEPKEKNEDIEDDGFIHITIKGGRYAFYNGQDKGMFGEKDIPKFKEIVINAIKIAEKE